MSSMDRDAITRALTARVCRAGLSGADLRVWLAVVDRTLTWRWLSDSVDHTVLRNTAAVTRPGRGLAALAEAGLLHYRPGISRAGRTTKSAFVVLVPANWERYRSGGIVWSDDAEDEESDSVDESVQTYGPDGPQPAASINEVSHSGMDEMVHTNGPDEPHPVDGFVRRGMDEMIHLNHETSTTREDHEGGGHEEAGAWGADAATCERLQTPSAPRTGLVLADNDSKEESSRDGEHDPGPVVRRVGAATGSQAVERFQAETGLPLSQRTRGALALSLDEVAEHVSPNEMLLGLGYWHEKRAGRWPEDAAERVGEALAMESLPIDPCNGMHPAGAIQEGRCRAQVAALTRTERDALTADPLVRVTGYGLDWPTPGNVTGLLPEPSSQGSWEMDAAIRDRLAQPGAWGRISASMARLDEALQAGAL